MSFDTDAAPAARVRRRLSARGTVQGVGFRPFVFGLAERCGLAGWVLNEPGGVLLEVEGPAAALDAFRAALASELPPLAVLSELASEEIPARGEVGFEIRESAARGAATTPISPDVATCAACLRELLDPADRRFGYPFLNCTHCGPRFTITEHAPYDRATTTMRGFALCDACRREYEDPRDRRFHAQPTACPACGPHCWLASPAGERLAEREAALTLARARLARGEIVAVKGIGGFHLACDATNEAAVAELRRRKGRAEKPFAVLVRDLAMAAELAAITEDEAAWLASPARPIVLVAKRPSALAPAVAPGQGTVGLLLPYAPLHHLLIADRPLVFTSGNASEEPIAKDNDEALARLGHLADAFLLHDRPIHTVCDDSVVRLMGDHPLFLRRSRGYAPAPLAVAEELPSLLAVGGELKATFCATRGRAAYLSQHLGDWGNLETLTAFERTLALFLELFELAPEAIAADLHPGYLATQWAERYAAARGLPVIKVQHHHAHIAALLLEQSRPLATPILGLACDGTGYGLDGTIWGGELLLCRGGEVTRLGGLEPVPQPGGDALIRSPARMALCHLAAAGLPWQGTPLVATSETERRILSAQLTSGRAIRSSSLGRLFDAVAALVGCAPRATYEGQAAMELEALASSVELNHDDTGYALGLGGEGGLRLTAAPLLAAVVEELGRGTPRELVAARFHEGVARGLAAVCESARAATGITLAGLSGGVFQNARLLARTRDLLRAAGFDVLLPARVPANDGGLALGQAAVASARLRGVP